MPIVGHSPPSAFLDIVFPGSTSVNGSQDRRGLADLGQRRLLAVPAVGTARMYLPEEPRLAGPALRRARRSTNRRDEWTTRVAVALLHSGAGRFLQSHVHARRSDADVESVLGSWFGRPVRVAVFLGPPRANRKPVLQVIADDGELLGVAKVAVNSLTERLVRHEAAWLQRLGTRPLTHVEVPRLLTVTDVGERAVVVQSPLDITSGPADPPDTVLREGLLAIAHMDGVERRTVGSSLHARSLHEALGGLGEETAALASQALADVAELTLPYGAWHGDLAPWNLSHTKGRLQVWDWERTATGVPLGLDALHYRFMPRLKSGEDVAASGVELLASAPEVLAGWGHEDRRSAHAVALLYLLDVATRFAGDGQAGTGVRAGEVGAWTTPALRHWPGLVRG